MCIEVWSGGMVIKATDSHMASCVVRFLDLVAWVGENHHVWLCGHPLWGQWVFSFPLSLYVCIEQVHAPYSKTENV